MTKNTRFLRSVVLLLITIVALVLLVRKITQPITVTFELPIRCTVQNNICTDVMQGYRWEFAIWERQVEFPTSTKDPIYRCALPGEPPTKSDDPIYDVTNGCEVIPTIGIVNRDGSVLLEK